MTTRNNIDDLKNIIRHSLLMNPDYLIHVEMNSMDDFSMNEVLHFIKVKACYENSLICALILGYSHVVLGSVVVQVGDDRIPVEHCWISDGKRYYDPTFQLLESINNSPCLNSAYFSLYEIKVDDYLSESLRISDSSGPRHIDIYALRRLSEFKHLFIQKR